MEYRRKREYSNSGEDEVHHRSSSPMRHKRRRRSITPDYDDEERHYIVRLGESLSPRYKVLSIMGEGTFGKVVECWDRDRSRFVAIKIIRSIEKYREAAKMEIEILEELARKDPHSRSPCIQLLSWFDYRNHLCMVFDRYGPSLYDFLKKNHYQPFNINIVRDFSIQLLEAVSFIHSIRLIHTDLKPENILLASSSYKLQDAPSSSRYRDIRVPTDTTIKLIDFGGATFNDQHHTAIVSTRHYRAPEVILNLGWSYPCDIWSVGCILIELYTGDALFQTHQDREHLAIMERILGPLPKNMIDGSRYYSKEGKLLWPKSENHSSNDVRAVEKTVPLREIIHDDDFYDFVSEMLRYDPDKRVTAKTALTHNFLRRNK